ncbi:hypothetical protein NGK10_05055 [Enterobacter quasiroggenkampii]|uniref:hypothetical protein n=1 Tax=Enterobacter quasiroggenkampii TaxID=2497436 RepID=UPI0021D0F69E|nr:hypothetical protein [Enterobacter quasiroggenkampii]MCU6396996.1 hypothetical protein [Enterobacter quasiroggenkampii]MEB7931707.1 hypothetical protein [Enterobacter quasiroggenkampii]
MNTLTPSNGIKVTEKAWCRFYPGDFSLLYNITRLATGHRFTTQITPQGYIYSGNKRNAVFSCTPPVKKGVRKAEYASGIDDVYAKTAGMFLLIKVMREVEW